MREKNPNAKNQCDSATNATPPLQPAENLSFWGQKVSHCLCDKVRQSATSCEGVMAKILSPYSLRLFKLSLEANKIRDGVPSLLLLITLMQRRKKGLQLPTLEVV